MAQVCEEQNCEDQVFLVAIHLLDRFNSCVAVKKHQLQLVASVCLLLASKLRQCNYLSVELLAYYTDNSITKAEIMVRILTMHNFFTLLAISNVNIIFHMAPHGIKSILYLRINKKFHYYKFIYISR